MIEISEPITFYTQRFSEVCTSICKIFKLKVKRADPMRTCLTFNQVCLTFFILSPGPFTDYLYKKFILDKLRDSLTRRMIFLTIEKPVKIFRSSLSVLDRFDQAKKPSYVSRYCLLSLYIESNKVS